MVNNNNSALTKELIEGGRLQTIQGVPQTISNYIQPVMEVNPKLLRICNLCKSASASNATGVTIYTTPTGQDFYLVSCQLGVIKDVTSTSTNTNIQVFIDGVSISLLRIPGITLTPQSEVISLAFPYPIKIDRGTAISTNSSSNVANITYVATIQGYIVDNVNA